MRDVLNQSTNEADELLYPKMPLVGGDRGDWTVRGVQMVLSNDGY